MTSSVHSLIMDMTASMCDCNVTYCDHVNSCIQSSEGKMSYYFIVPGVTYERFEGFRSMLWYAVLLSEFKVKRILGKKVMFIVIFYKSFFKRFSNDKNQVLGFFLRKRWNQKSVHESDAFFVEYQIYFTTHSDDKTVAIQVTEKPWTTDSK